MDLITVYYPSVPSTVNIIHLQIGHNKIYYLRSIYRFQLDD